MAIKLTCPQCKKLLAVPTKKADGHVTCPVCHGRVWVSREAVVDAAKSDDGEPGPGEKPSGKRAAGDANSAERAAGAAVSKRKASGQTSGEGNGGGLAPAARAKGEEPDGESSLAARATRPAKVARFISAEAAQSTLQVAADGNLPELRLQESDKPSDAKQAGRGTNPMVLAAVLAASLLACLAILFVGGGGESVSQRDARAHARYELESLAQNVSSDRPLAPYQEALNEGLRAYKRGDLRGERAAYLRVDRMLRAENRASLTGSRSSDEALQRALAILLARP